MLLMKENSAAPAQKKYWIFLNYRDRKLRKSFRKIKERKFAGFYLKNQLNKAISGDAFNPEIPLKRIGSFTKITAGLALTASIINLYPAQSAKPHTPEISIVTNTMKNKKQKSFTKMMEIQ